MEKDRAEEIVHAVKEKYDLDTLIMVGPSVPEETYKFLDELHTLWYKYGKHGPEHTHGNHRFIQNIIQLEVPVYQWEEFSDRVNPPAEEATEECREEVDRILRNLAEVEDI